MGVDWITRLQSQYVRLRQLADELERILSGRRPADPTDLWRVRWAIMSLALTSLRTRRDALNALLEAEDSPRAAAMTARSDREQGDFLEAYLKHSQRWDVEAELTDWHRYRTDALVMLDWMRARLSRTEAELVPLLAEAQARRDS